MHGGLKPVASLDEVTHRYGTVAALAEVTLDLSPGFYELFAGVEPRSSARR